VDTLTAANLFIGHATGAFLFLLFTWLLVSEVLSRRALRRVRLRIRETRAHLHDPYCVGTAESVTAVSTE
jgi:hypothetical protein